MSKMTEHKWTEDAKKRFVGKKITNVRWMTDKEAEKYGWDHRPIVMYLSDGTIIFPQQDDEGNNGGALADTNEKTETWPVLYPGFEKGDLPKGHPNISPVEKWKKEWDEREKRTREIEDTLDREEEDSE